MPSFTTETRVAASPARVFAEIIDLKKWTLFKGYGPLPAILDASLPDGGPGGGTVTLGSRIRVQNSDGSVHHEVVEVFEPGQRYQIRMELTPPVSWIMASIVEDVRLSPADSPPDSTRLLRHFVVTARGWWTAPVVWLIAGFLLPRAVERHNVAVAEGLVG